MRLFSYIVAILLSACSLYNISLLQAAETPKNVRLLLTSNIQGCAVPEMSDQETKDPLLVLAQNLMAEKEKGVDLYLDLGNGFYPGTLSKFSSGSIMMDFFDFFSCAGTLVSSNDMRIGLENLEFLRKYKKSQLLSANIIQKGKPVFSPFMIKEIGGVRIAFVGLSSKRVMIDVAEKELYDISQENEKDVLVPILKKLDTMGIDHIVLLSGLKLSLTMELLQTHTQFDMAICGGDYTGRLFDGKISRIDLNDGRSIIFLDSETDYYTIDLCVGQGITLQSLVSHQAVPSQRTESAYAEFRNRLSLWKQKYHADQIDQIAKSVAKEVILTDQKLLQLLRDKFNSEIAIVDTKTINPYPIKKDISHSDLLQIVNLDYKIFTFQLTGSQLAQIASQNSYDLEIEGLTKGKKNRVQGYTLENERRYSVAATQSAYRKIRQTLDSKIDYDNTWKTVSDVLIADLQNGQVTLRDDYTYLDKRFRTLVDIKLSNYISAGSVDRGSTIDTPVSQPSDDYNKWGLEDEIDLCVYNMDHRFVLTPYLFYIKQDDDYIQNLLRGTFLYEHNLGDLIRPYNKFQCDTVVESVDGQRPTLIRETMGGSLYGEYFTGLAGLGFEKNIQDSSDDAVYGLEVIMTFKYPFLKYFTYTLHLDNFLSTQNPETGRFGLRSEIKNTLSAKLNSWMSLSLRYDYFYYYDIDIREEYRSSQIFTTLDLNTDWKFW
ncbi:hypothetical protein [uncultured Desulfobacter sp.]|uniref:hypothetical protein n=1 Tax=uncultured Desulfobacter sp. TaxID=240139 RepID=UPI002AAC226D|nr:hypothetical protein [uncultured Desulfobacter sp.]